MSLPAELDPGLRLRGRVLEWHATKGCGFAEDGRGRIFIHIRDFAERHTKPCVGDAITYSRGTDQKGRPCAKQICQVNDGGRLRPRDFFVLGVLLCTPALALWRVAPPALGGALVVTALLASVASYLFYAWDKSRARARAWRIPERVLHGLEFIGGWPGAFLAQRRLRHKITKLSYLLIFWLIVATHTMVALDALLGWRLSRSAFAELGAWVEGLNADSRERAPARF